jgi:hypothetical protein
VSVLVGLEGEVVKTLQSIKKGINLLDERRADELQPVDGLAEVDPDADEYDDDVEEDASLPVRR